QSILSLLGMTAFDESDLVTARSCFEESLAIARAFGGKGAIAVSLYFLGRIACQRGDLCAARMLWDECRRVDEEHGTKAGAVLGALAHLAAMEDDLGAARALWKQSLAEAQHLRIQDRIAKALRGLADVARRQGDDVGSCSLYAQSLE